MYSADLAKVILVTRHICSACGHLDRQEDAFDRDGFSFDERGASYKGVALPLPPALFKILRGMAASRHVVTLDQLCLHMGSDVMPCTAHVHASRLRKMLQPRNIPIPFVTVWGKGYLWEAPTVKRKGK